MSPPLIKPITSMSSLHSDIIRTHILPRLDGPSLASFSSTCSQFYSLSDDENLWSNICTVTWPSCSHPRIRQLISSFPNGHRSYFSDSFPHLLTHHTDTPPQNPCSLYPSQLISAVDIHHKSKLIFSKVHDTETLSRWFKCASFQIDLVDPKNCLPPIQIEGKRFQTLMEDLTLTWNMFLGKRAAALSSFHPVSVYQHWLTKDISVNFATILSVDEEVDVKCEIIVAFEENMKVYEISMHMRDMDGVCLNGQNSLEILLRAIESGGRKNQSREYCREKYANYMNRMMERLHRREKNLSNKWRSDAIWVPSILIMVFLTFSVLTFM